MLLYLYTNRTLNIYMYPGSLTRVLGAGAPQTDHIALARPPSHLFRQVYVTSSQFNNPPLGHLSPVSSPTEHAEQRADRDGPRPDQRGAERAPDEQRLGGQHQAHPEDHSGNLGNQMCNRGN